MRILLKIIGFFCLSISAQQAYAANLSPQNWVKYENARFGTQAIVPVNGFSKSPPPINADGQTWQANNGQGQFSLFGAYLVVAMNFNELPAIYKKYMLDDGITINYSNKGEDWFVLSGSKNNRIYYHKYQLNTVCRNMIIDGFSAEYNVGSKAYFEPLIIQISRSLKGSQNGYGC